MSPLPFSDPTARVLFDVVLAVFAVCEWRVSFRSRQGRRGAKSEWTSLGVVVVAVCAGVVGAFVLAAHVHGAAIRVARWPLFGVGIVAMAAGIVVRQWAIGVLGRYFTTDVRVQEGQTVVDRGPYRFVRHPSYSGMILTFVGAGLALGNWLAFAVIALLPAAGLVFRMRVEERTLLAALGEPYRRFAEGRKRLVPGVW